MRESGMNDTQTLQQPRMHPGAGRRKGMNTPKGRQVDPKALTEIQALLGNRSRQRDLLIEHLHLIQDRYKHLSARHLAALAQEMRLALTEVYEVATFYAHFDVVLEDEAPPPALTIRVCDSLTCEMMGAQQLLSALKKQTDPKKIRVVRAPCMGQCATAPVAEVGHNPVCHATPETVLAAVKAGDTHAHAPAYKDFDAYRAEGGYRLLEDCLAGKRKPEDLIAVMEGSGLRGLGGAGFPSGRKWKFVRAEPGPRLMAVNGDEGEPGTFKDRIYLESDPHRFLEGMLVAAWVVEAPEVYVYIRDEYPGVLALLPVEIAKLEKAGLAK
jgi:formate dehydrogenase